MQGLGQFPSWQVGLEDLDIRKRWLQGFLSFVSSAIRVKAILAARND